MGAASRCGEGLCHPGQGVYWWPSVCSQQRWKPPSAGSRLSLLLWGIIRAALCGLPPWPPRPPGKDHAICHPVPSLSPQAPVYQPSRARRALRGALGIHCIWINNMLSCWDLWWRFWFYIESIVRSRSWVWNIQTMILILASIVFKVKVEQFKDVKEKSPHPFSLVFILLPPLREAVYYYGIKCFAHFSSKTAWKYLSYPSPPTWNFPNL